MHLSAANEVSMPRPKCESSPARQRYPGYDLAEICHVWIVNVMPCRSEEPVKPDMPLPMLVNVTLLGAVVTVGETRRILGVRFVSTALRRMHGFLTLLEVAAGLSVDGPRAHLLRSQAERTAIH